MATIASALRIFLSSAFKYPDRLSSFLLLFFCCCLLFYRFSFFRLSHTYISFFPIKLNVFGVVNIHHLDLFSKCGWKCQNEVSFAHSICYVNLFLFFLHATIISERYFSLFFFLFFVCFFKTVFSLKTITPTFHYSYNFI